MAGEHWQSLSRLVKRQRGRCWSKLRVCVCVCVKMHARACVVWVSGRKRGQRGGEVKGGVVREGQVLVKKKRAGVDSRPKFTVSECVCLRVCAKDA